MGHDPLWIDLAYLHLYAPIIEEEGIAWLDARENLRVSEIDPLFIARRLVAIEDEVGTGLDTGFLARESADPELGSLEIGENADRPSALGFDAADRAVKLIQHLVRCMAPIDADDVRTGNE